MSKRPWIAAAASALCGVPLYLLLDGFDALPPALRELPWPLALLVVAAAVAAWRSSRGVLLGAASGLAVLLFAAGTAARLPQQAPDLLSGAPLPAAALVSDQGAAMRLSDLRGPLVLVVYRGSS